MVHVVFEYADELSGWKWRNREYYFSSLEEYKTSFCTLVGFPIKLRIISVKEV